MMTLDPMNLLFIIIFTVFWILPWKGYALWTAARRNEKSWFIFLVATTILNVFGLIDIFYIFFVAKKKPEDIKNVISRGAQKTAQAISFKKEDK